MLIFQVVCIVQSQNDVEDEGAFSPDRKIFDLDGPTEGRPPSTATDEQKTTTSQNPTESTTAIDDNEER